MRLHVQHLKGNVTDTSSHSEKQKASTLTFIYASEHPVCLFVCLFFSLIAAMSNYILIHEGFEFVGTQIHTNVQENTYANGIINDLSSDVSDPSACLHLHLRVQCIFPSQETSFIKTVLAKMFSFFFFFSHWSWHCNAPTRPRVYERVSIWRVWACVIAGLWCGKKWETHSKLSRGRAALTPIRRSNKVNWTWN